MYHEFRRKVNKVQGSCRDIAVVFGINLKRQLCLPNYQIKIGTGKCGIKGQKEIRHKFSTHIV
jgi:hypothetical protein